jgi:hypothetical protein
VAKCISKQVSKHHSVKYQDTIIAYIVIVLLIGIGASI